MRNVITLAVLIMCVLALPVHALTQQDVDVLIRAGLIPPEKIPAARAAASGAAANTQQSTQTGTPVRSGTVSRTPAGSDDLGCLNLSIDLFEGMSGTAVSSLQQFLKKSGHFTFPSITGYFGPVTREAIEKFQQDKSIVLNGDPTTTGFGAVGPQTRERIKELTCVGGSGTGSVSGGSGSSTADFFGQNLDSLLDGYEPNFDYDINNTYTFDTSYDINFDYNIDTSYNPDISYNPNTSFSGNFDYEPNFGSSSNSPIRVTFEVQAANGQFIAGGFNPVAVSSRNVVLKWASSNADSCTLTGDFPERTLSVPEDGQATIFLVNPSYSVPVDEDTDKPLFGYRLNCIEDDPYGDGASAWLMLHIVSTTTATTTR